MRLFARHRYDILKSVSVDVHVWNHSFEGAWDLVMAHYIRVIFGASFEWTQWVLDSAEIFRYRDASRSPNTFLQHYIKGRTPDSEISLTQARKRDRRLYLKMKSSRVPVLNKEVHSLSRRGWRGTFAEPYRRRKAWAPDMMVSHVELEKLKAANRPKPPPKPPVKK